MDREQIVAALREQVGPALFGEADVDEMGELIRKLRLVDVICDGGRDAYKAVVQLVMQRG